MKENTTSINKIDYETRKELNKKIRKIEKQIEETEKQISQIESEIADLEQKFQTSDTFFPTYTFPSSTRCLKTNTKQSILPSNNIR